MAQKLTTLHAERASAAAAALLEFQRRVQALVRRQGAATRWFKATLALLAQRDCSAVVASESATLLHVPQDAFHEALQLTVSRDGLPASCAGQHLHAPPVALCRRDSDVTCTGCVYPLR